MLIPFVPADCIAARSGRQYHSRGYRSQIKIERRPSCWLPRLRPGFAALVAPPRPSAGRRTRLFRDRHPFLSRGASDPLCYHRPRPRRRHPCRPDTAYRSASRTHIPDVAALVNLDAVHVRIVRIAVGDNVSNFLFARRYLGKARCALEREMECLAGWGQLRSFGGRLCLPLLNEMSF